MGQTVFNTDNYVIKEYGEFGQQYNAPPILSNLQDYVNNYSFEENDFYTFIAAFQGPQGLSDQEFERLLWQQLQYIHNIDNQYWDSSVSSNPDDKNFSFSIAGKAFYIVGMHPESNRVARQSPQPALVFNLHWQFEKLRQMGSYDIVRDKIRANDEAIQGNYNPMMEDFGEKSEARQYSGRQVGDSWKCPFHAKK